MPTFAAQPHTMPAVHSFRRLPLSPLDTDHDVPHIPLSVHPGTDFDMPTSPTGHYLGAAPERPRFQPRRTSTLSYQNSGARDFRDRSYSRTPRNLVVVIPPPDFPLHQGQLGNVLSMGPRHRLSQGSLMPLFPSMFGQLNAIAREYNFPSTVGLCLYLHINENGITTTPRISDDSWQYLFGHLFDARPPSGGQQLPIGGGIEFDIDLNKARWFDAWVSGTLHDSDASPPVVTSRASLGAHWRGEIQTMNVDEQPAEDRWDASGSPTLATNSRPGTLRHLPKKLSLVDRLESYGLHVPPILQNHPDHPDSPQTHGTNALSPAPQSAIPQVVKSDLECRVNSWRATTELYPVSMIETYQPTPDVGVSVRVTTMDAYALGSNFRRAGDIDEYLWVTSAGPNSPVMKSPIPSSRPFSAHLDRRADGTIPLTPTTMTSWGPINNEWHSVVSSASRLPSPDMGERMVEDMMAPRLCAVWGNSFGWRSAATWKEVYPYSTAQTKPMVRVQLQDSSGLVPQYPNLVIYPGVGSHPDTHSSHSIFARPQSSTRSVWGSSFGWQRAVTWQKVYPYSIPTMQSVAPIQLRGAGGLVSKYPNLRIYPAIYPYLEIYPACIVEEDISRPVSVMLNGSNNLTTYYPTLVIYPAVYPHFDIYPQAVEGVKMKGSSLLNTSIYSLNGVSTLYPNLMIYPAVYPHFDLYPKALQINETLKQKGVNVKLVNVGCLTAEYPNMTIYPSAYPYLDIYPTQDTRMRTSSVVWSISFGWLTAKTWLQVYPLHTATPLTTRRAVDDPSRPCSQNPTMADIVVGKQAIWGTSFGWKSAATWRAVWPTAYARIHPNVSLISVHLGQQSNSSSNYPHLTIYPAAYPNFDIYPPRAAIVEVEGFQATKNNQCPVNLIPHYPNLVIYTAVYPHIDVYPPFARASVAVTRGNGQSNLRRRRIEMWRAKTAAQVGLVELLTNNHIWEADEPLQIDLADYAWSRTSAGPSTVELALTPSISGSVHIDRRIQGSVLLTPSTATTWGPQDDDRYSDIISIERLPSPDLGQRVLDDVENIEFTRQPWHLVWPFFGNASHVKNLPSVLETSVFVPEYPHLVIYPPAYPYFELYPAWANVPTSKNHVTESFANSNRYPVLDIYPAVYPYFDIYPAIDLRVEVPSRTVPNVWHERVEVRLPSQYPNFDIYRACYPYNLDYIYPFIHAIESTQNPIEVSRGYPWLVVYRPVYPFIIPYPGFLAEVTQPLKPQRPPSILSLPEWKTVSVKLPVRYPTLDIYSAGYPWSLESIYPAVSVDDCPGVVKPQYPCIWIYPTVYPFVQPYLGVSDSVHIPGALDEDEYGSAKAFLALSKFKHIDPESVVYPYFDLYPAPPTLPPQQERDVQDADVGDLETPPSQMSTIAWRDRKTHMELHASVFRCLEKQPVRNLKTHLQLHTKVFQDGVVWTPSGYTQDLSSLTMRKREDIPVRESQRRPRQDNSILRPPRSKSGTRTVQSPDKVVFPLGQPPALPPISPLRVRTPGVPSQPSLAVSETPMPRVSSPTNAFTHKRTTSSRLSQAVKSMMPGAQRRNSSATPVSPPEGHKEYVKDQQSTTRFLSLVDRRQTVVPPLPHTNTSEFLTRAPQSPQRKESVVFQRARAYEESTGAATNQSSSTVATKGTHSPFILPPLPPMPPIMDVVETIEKSKVTFP